MFYVGIGIGIPMRESKPPFRPPVVLLEGADEQEAPQPVEPPMKIGIMRSTYNRFVAKLIYIRNRLVTRR
jgi:hypothetical protein